MKVESTRFKDLLICTPEVYDDNRGYFMESFNQERFASATGLDINFVQDNESQSGKDVLRGLHFQVPPSPQAKLVRVSFGRVLDVVVDLRKSEPTFGQHFSIELTAEKKNMLFIPAGFAHGFLTLDEINQFVYKCSGYYSQNHEFSLRWNDPALGIDWPTKAPLVSQKDNKALSFKELDSPF